MRTPARFAAGSSTCSSTSAVPASRDRAGRGSAIALETGSGVGRGSGFGAGVVGGFGREGGGEVNPRGRQNDEFFLAPAQLSEKWTWSVCGLGPM